MPFLNLQAMQHMVQAALTEDAPWGDVTSNAVLPAEAQTRLAIRFKSNGVVCGLALAQQAFMLLEPHAHWSPLSQDGQTLQQGEIAAKITGSALALLQAERVALNFLQHLSGIATLTAHMVKQARQGNAKVQVLDTRKTTPGWRHLEKYAVHIGGGINHRQGLSDGVLIKDNHLAVLQKEGIDLIEAIARARKHIPHGYKIQVEVDTLAQLKTAIAAGADSILLDNMNPEQLQKAVDFAQGKVLLEASGGITADNIRSIAQSGVDYISVGALTHSAPALDIGLDFMP